MIIKTQNDLGIWMDHATANLITLSPEKSRQVKDSK
jgi:hypothetical protein